MTGLGGGVWDPDLGGWVPDDDDDLDDEERAEREYWRDVALEMRGEDAMERALLEDDSWEP